LLTFSTLTCLLEYTKAHIAPDAIFDAYVVRDSWTLIDIGLPPNAAPALARIFATILAEYGPAGVAMAAIWFAYYNFYDLSQEGANYSGETPNILPFAKVNIPAEGFGKPDPNEGCVRNEPITILSVRGLVSIVK
jgi:hypothetical protein